MATLTLKNVPEELYAELKRRAVANRRSLNQETIVSLEEATADSDASAKSDVIDGIDAFRASIAARGYSTTAEEIDDWISHGQR